MFEILKYEWTEIFRSKWTYVYALMLGSLSLGLFLLAGSAMKAIVSLLNLVMVVVPLVSMLIAIVYLHSSRPFVELLLCQPLKRWLVFSGAYLGVSLPLCLLFVLGIGLPFCFYGVGTGNGAASLLALLLSGLFLTLIFTGLAFLIAVAIEDKLKSFVLCLLLWLYLIVVHDGVILLLVTWFSDYPIERAAMILSLLNPISMARILILLNLDIAVLMGLTGTLVQNFLGSAAGVIVSLVSLLVWLICPLTAGMYLFQRKDF